MRPLGAFVVAMLLCGCLGWHVRDSSELTSQDEAARYVVVTDGLAYELSDGTIEGSVLKGRMVHGWIVPRDAGDIAALDDLEPEDIAKVLGWQPSNAPWQMVHIATSDIKSLRRWEEHLGRGVAIAVPLGLVVLGVLVVSTARFQY
ncbi:MAG TPA: hypothetical protein VMJ10_23515 [Kofleriaceae bacterium]|nr:hypothetical protein [Kofleriaceae bacterium]